MIFTGTRLEKAVNAAREQLERVADLLCSKDDPGHDTEKDAFLSAVENYDDSAANKLITDALIRYQGDNNVLYGLEKFYEKFGLQDKMNSVTPVQTIRFLYGHYDSMDSKLKESGL